MSIFPNKATFFAKGIEVCLESVGQQDCHICSGWLGTGETESTHTTTEKSLTHGQHTVVVNIATTLAEPEIQFEPHESHNPIKMISCCNKIFSFRCLDIWLQRKNTCPACHAQLFPAHEEANRLANKLQAAVDAAVHNTLRLHMVEQETIVDTARKDTSREHQILLAETMLANTEVMRRRYPHGIDSDALQRTADMLRADIEEMRRGRLDLCGPDDANFNEAEAEELIQSVLGHMTEYNKSNKV